MLSPNIALAIAAAKSGGLIPFPSKIGDMMVGSLTGLSAPSELDVTRKPVMGDYDVSDAAIDMPQDLVMDICLGNPNLSATAAAQAALSGTVTTYLDPWWQKRDYLYKVQADRELLDVITHEGWYTSMLLRLIDPYFDVDENYDAFFATLIFSEVKVVATGVAGLIDSALATKGKL